MLTLLAVLDLVVLSTIDGRLVLVNPPQVTQMREARPEGPTKQVHPKVHCVIWLTDGTFVTVAEDCNRVRELLEGGKR